MTVRQLSYDDQLTSEEARERLKEVEDAERGLQILDESNEYTRL